MSGAADRPGRRRLIPRSKLTIESVTCVLATLLLAWLVLYPLSVLLVGSLRTDLPMRAGRFTLANFSALLSEPANLEAIVNTMVSFRASPRWRR